TRLYSIPYKREHEQMFELAGRARQNGAEVRVQKQPKGSVDSSEELGAQILLPEDIMPKR
ncbi:MAG: hypothetical protein N2235_05075, partial [Fischerella sp.]|nr:hypothetical protein [Fischerella sp.]